MGRAAIPTEAIHDLLQEHPDASNYALAKQLTEVYGISHRGAMLRIARIKKAGVSRLYKTEDGGLMWVKERPQKERFEEEAREYVEALCAEVKPLERIPAPKNVEKRRRAFYMVGDPHIGMLSWGEETGDDFDLKIAERDLCAAAEDMVARAPATDSAVLVLLGDVFHMDNTRNETFISRHKLDVDDRYIKVMRVGIRTVRHMIDAAAAKHKTVHVRIVSGNHDPHSSLTLRFTMEALYEKNPRVMVEAGPEPFWIHEFGKNLIGIHHGHELRKPAKMAAWLAQKAPEAWGRTRYRWVWHGHVHHRYAEEHMGVEVESFRALCGPDAWHNSEGWAARREMECIVLDEEYGRDFRYSSSLERIRGLR